MATKTMPRREADTLLTIPEGAAALAISPEFFAEMLRRGDLPRVKIGRAVRVSVRALQDYIAKQEAASAPDGEADWILR